MVSQNFRGNGLGVWLPPRKCGGKQSLVSCFSRRVETVPAVTAVSLTADQRIWEFTLKFKSQERKVGQGLFLLTPRRTTWKGQRNFNRESPYVGPSRQPAVEWGGGQPKERHCLVHESNTSRGPKKSLWRILKKCPQGKRVSFEHFSLVEKKKNVHERREHETILKPYQFKWNQLLYAPPLPFHFLKLQQQRSWWVRKRQEHPYTHTHTLQEARLHCGWKKIQH